jgi:CBS domain-containing protein
MAELVSVSELMTKQVKTVRPDTSVREVVATMNRLGIGSVVVVQGDRPVGIITERDVLSRVVEACIPPETRKAREIMTSPIVAIDQNASVKEATQIMVHRKIKKLIVVDQGKLVGIITHTDIISKMPNMMSTLEVLLRPQKTY